MGDPFSPVRAGEKLRISARAWNDVRTVARDLRQHGQPPQRNQPDPAVHAQACQLRVRNDFAGSTAVDEGDVVGLNAPVFTPDQLGFKESPTLLSAVLVAAEHLDASWGIALEPIPAGMIGHVAVAGSAICRVNWGGSSELAQALRPVAGQRYLAPASNGGRGFRGRAVWTQTPGSSLSTSLVLLGFAAAGVFPVTVAKTGGADGTDTTAASWVYTVTSLAGLTLGTSVPLTRPRPNGSMAFGTGYGLAFYAADGTLKLWDAGEVEATTAEC